MDGKRSRVSFVIISLLGLSWRAGGPAAAQSASVARYDVFEAALSSSKSYSNPFSGVTVTVTFTAPSGRKLTGSAFHDGGNVWRVRVGPDETGTWTWTTSSTDPSDGGLHGRSGSFSCTSSSNKGFIRTDGSRKYWFSFSDGSPFYGMGDTCYGMVTSISNSERTSYLNARSSQGFNFVRFFASGYPFTKHSSLPAGDAWAWGGSSSSPDYDRLNPQYFRRLETILGELRSRGLFAEVEVFSYYAAPFNTPSVWSAARQNLWAKYVVSRLSAYSTIFLWTVTNEYENYPDGKYRYDNPSDDTWVKSMGALFHASDPHKHPTTAHNFTFDADGGIGGRFGSSADVDVLTQQKWGNATFNGQFMDGDASGIEQAIGVDRKYNKPVINTENGYERLSGYPSTDNGAAVGTDKCRRAAWRVFAAGGATYAAGFQGTWRGTSETTWMGNPAPFIVDDNGLAGHLGHYLNFIRKTDFRNLSPAQNLVNSPNLCLGNAGKEYVVYAPSGGNVVLNLSSASGSFNLEWLNPRSGAFQGQTTVAGGASRTLTAPDGNDWVLRLTQGTTGALPDVIVTSLAVANGIFTCTVRNQGNAPTPSGVMVGVGYSVGGTWRTYGGMTGPLAAGATTTIGTSGGSYVIPNGTHTISAFVDDVNRFIESNEGNNQFSQTVSVGGGSAGTGTGLMGQYYDNLDLTGLKVSRTDATVDYDWGTGSPDGSMGADTFSARWTGQVQPQFSETYTFTTVSDDGVRLWVNGQLLINNWTNHAATENSGSIAVSAGQKLDLRMEFYENGGDAVAKLLWSSPSTPRQTIPRSQLYPPAAAGQIPGLVGRWKMDEGSGTVAGDSSGLGNTGSLVNGPAWSSGALSFDGVDDRVQVADSPSLDLTNQGTIGAWIHPRSLPDGYGTVVEKFSGGGQGAGYQLLLGASNTAGLWLMSGGTSSNIQSDANLFSLNGWTHIAVTWNGSSIQYYKNGQPFGSARSQPRSASANTLPLILGLDTGYTGRLNGLLDDVRIYDRALGASEIQAVFGGAP